MFLVVDGAHLQRFLGAPSILPVILSSMPIVKAGATAQHRAPSSQVWKLRLGQAVVPR